MRLRAKESLWLTCTAFALLLFAAPFVADEGGKKEPPITVTGYISDSMCGLDHSDMMDKHGGEAKFDETACVKACIKGGAKYVLADREAKKTYNIKDQHEVADYAGKRVEIEGELKEDGTLDVHKVRLAPK